MIMYTVGSVFCLVRFLIISCIIVLTSMTIRVRVKYFYFLFEFVKKKKTLLITFISIIIFNDAFALWLCSNYLYFTLIALNNRFYHETYKKIMKVCVLYCFCTVKVYIPFRSYWLMFQWDKVYILHGIGVHNNVIGFIFGDTYSVNWKSCNISFYL